MKMSRRCLLVGTAVSALVANSPSSAWVHGLASIIPVAGKSVLNGFDRITSFAFCNMLKDATNFALSTSVTPASLNDSGFPISTPGALYGGQAAVPDISGASNPSWVLKMPQGGGTGGFFLSNALTISATGGTVNGVTYGAGGQTTGSKSGVTVTGQSQWRIVFTFNSYPSSGVTIGFPNSGTYTNMSGIILCRLSDETAVDANPNALTPEFTSGILATGCSDIRMMNWNLAGLDLSAASQFAYRYPTTAFSFQNLRFPPAAWAGSTSGTDTYTCGDTATPSLSAWVDGLTWQALFVNANTSTTPTIAPNGLAAKTIVSARSGGALTSGQIAANTFATLIYDAILDQVIYQAGGMLYGPPTEIKIAICNQLNKNYWHNFPINFTLASVTAESNLIAANLNSQLSCSTEYSNEVWNQFQLAAVRGTALGFTSANLRNYFGYYGLRVRQMMPLVTVAFAARPTTINPIMAWMAFTGSTAALNTYMLQGADLAPLGTGTGQGNATYVAYTGSANYTTAPNRPFNTCKWGSYAIYYNGAQCLDVDAHYITAGTANLTGLKAAADNFASGNPSQIASALAFVGSDVRAGTLASAGTLGTQTLLALDTTVGGPGLYNRFQSLFTANSYTQKIVAYEGGLQIWYPSVATAATLWGDASYGGLGGKIDLLFSAWKNSSDAAAVVLLQCKQFMGLDSSSPNFGLLPNALKPSWFTFDGANNQWSFFPLNVIAGNPYQTLTGMAQWNAS